MTEGVSNVVKTGLKKIVYLRIWLPESNRNELVEEVRRATGIKSYLQGF